MSLPTWWRCLATLAVVLCLPLAQAQCVPTEVTVGLTTGGSENFPAFQVDGAFVVDEEGYLPLSLQVSSDCPTAELSPSLLTVSFLEGHADYNIDIERGLLEFDLTNSAPYSRIEAEIGSGSVTVQGTRTVVMYATNNLSTATSLYLISPTKLALHVNASDVFSFAIVYAGSTQTKNSTDFPLLLPFAAGDGARYSVGVTDVTSNGTFDGLTAQIYGGAHFGCHLHPQYEGRTLAIDTDYTNLLQFDGIIDCPRDLLGSDSECQTVTISMTCTDCSMMLFEPGSYLLDYSDLQQQKITLTGKVDAIYAAFRDLKVKAEPDSTMIVLNVTHDWPNFSQPDVIEISTNFRAPAIFALKVIARRRFQIYWTRDPFNGNLPDTVSVTWSLQPDYAASQQNIANTSQHTDTDLTFDVDDHMAAFPMYFWVTEHFASASALMSDVYYFGTPYVEFLVSVPHHLSYPDSVVGLGTLPSIDSLSDHLFQVSLRSLVFFFDTSNVPLADLQDLASTNITSRNFVQLVGTSLVLNRVLSAIEVFSDFHDEPFLHPADIEIEISDGVGEVEVKHHYVTYAPAYTAHPTLRYSDALVLHFPQPFPVPISGLECRVSTSTASAVFPFAFPVPRDTLSPVFLADNGSLPLILSGEREFKVEVRYYYQDWSGLVWTEYHPEQIISLGPRGAPRYNFAVPRPVSVRFFFEDLVYPDHRAALTLEYDMDTDQQNQALNAPYDCNVFDSATEQAISRSQSGTLSCRWQSPRLLLIEMSSLQEFLELGMELVTAPDVVYRQDGEGDGAPSVTLRIEPPLVSFDWEPILDVSASELRTCDDLRVQSIRSSDTHRPYLSHTISSDFGATTSSGWYFPAYYYPAGVFNVTLSITTWFGETKTQTQSVTKVYDETLMMHFEINGVSVVANETIWTELGQTTTFRVIALSPCPDLLAVVMDMSSGLAQVDFIQQSDDTYVGTLATESLTVGDTDVLEISATAGPLSASFAFAFHVRPPTPIAVDEELSSSLQYLIVKFARATDLAGMQVGVTAPCYPVLEDVSAELMGGVHSSCEWTQPLILHISLANATVQVGDVLTLHRIRDATGQSAPIQQLIMVPAPSTMPAEPQAVFDLPLQWCTCSGDLVLVGSKSTDSSGRALTYTWAVTSTANVSDLQTFLAARHSSIVTIPASYLTEASYDFTLTIDNWLGQTDALSNSIDIQAPSVVMTSFTTAVVTIPSTNAQNYRIEFDGQFVDVPHTAIPLEINLPPPFSTSELHVTVVPTVDPPFAMSTPRALAPSVQNWAFVDTPTRDVLNFEPTLYPCLDGGLPCYAFTLELECLNCHVNPMLISDVAMANLVTSLRSLEVTAIDASTTARLTYTLTDITHNHTMQDSIQLEVYVPFVPSDLQARFINAALVMFQWKLGPHSSIPEQEQPSFCIDCFADLARQTLVASQSALPFFTREATMSLQRAIEDPLFCDIRLFRESWSHAPSQLFSIPEITFTINLPTVLSSSRTVNIGRIEGANGASIFGLAFLKPSPSSSLYFSVQGLNLDGLSFLLDDSGGISELQGKMDDLNTVLSQASLNYGNVVPYPDNTLRFTLIDTSAAFGYNNQLFFTHTVRADPTFAQVAPFYSNLILIGSSLQLGEVSNVTMTLRSFDYALHEWQATPNTWVFLVDAVPQSFFVLPEAQEHFDADATLDVLVTLGLTTTSVSYTVNVSLGAVPYVPQPPSVFSVNVLPHDPYSQDPTPTYDALIVVFDPPCGNKDFQPGMFHCEDYFGQTVVDLGGGELWCTWLSHSDLVIHGIAPDNVHVPAYDIGYLIGFKEGHFMDRYHVGGTAMSATSAPVQPPTTLPTMPVPELYVNPPGMGFCEPSVIDFEVRNVDPAASAGRNWLVAYSLESDTDSRYQEVDAVFSIPVTFDAANVTVILRNWFGQTSQLTVPLERKNETSILMETSLDARWSSNAIEVEGAYIVGGSNSIQLRADYYPDCIEPSIRFTFLEGVADVSFTNLDRTLHFDLAYSQPYSKVVARVNLHATEPVELFGNHTVVMYATHTIPAEMYVFDQERFALHLDVPGFFRFEVRANQEVTYVKGSDFPILLPLRAASYAIEVVDVTSNGAFSTSVQFSGTVGFEARLHPNMTGRVMQIGQVYHSVLLLSGFDCPRHLSVSVLCPTTSLRFWCAGCTMVKDGVDATSHTVSGTMDQIYEAYERIAVRANPDASTVEFYAELEMYYSGISVPVEVQTNLNAPAITSFKILTSNRFHIMWSSAVGLDLDAAIVTISWYTEVDYDASLSSPLTSRTGEFVDSGAEIAIPGRTVADQDPLYFWITEQMSDGRVFHSDSYVYQPPAEWVTLLLPQHLPYPIRIPGLASFPIDESSPYNVELYVSCPSGKLVFNLSSVPEHVLDSLSGESILSSNYLKLVGRAALLRLVLAFVVVEPDGRPFLNTEMVEYGFTDDAGANSYATHSYVSYAPPFGVHPDPVLRYSNALVLQFGAFPVPIQAMAIRVTDNRQLSVEIMLRFKPQMTRDTIILVDDIASDPSANLFSSGSTTFAVETRYEDVIGAWSAWDHDQVVTRSIAGAQAYVLVEPQVQSVRVYFEGGLWNNVSLAVEYDRETDQQNRPLGSIYECEVLDPWTRTALSALGGTILCYWNSSTMLMIHHSSLTNEVALGINVTMEAGQVFNKDGVGFGAAATTHTIQAPLQSPPWEAVLQAVPMVLGSCDELNVYSTQSTWTGRPYSDISISSDMGNFDFPKGYGVIDAFMFPFGDYPLTLSLTNWLGDVKTATVQVKKVDDGRAIEMDVEVNGAQRLKDSEVLIDWGAITTIVVTTSSPCFSLPDVTLSFTKYWGPNVPVDVVFKNISEREHELVLPTNVWAPRTEARISLDANAGPLSISFFVTLRVRSPTPSVSQFLMSDQAEYVQVSFDDATDCAGMSIGVADSCSYVLNSESLVALGGAASKCVWTDARTLRIHLVPQSTIKVNGQFTVQNIRSEDKKSLPLTSALRLPAPSTLPAVSTVFQLPALIGNCSNLILDGRASTGGAGRDLVYAWSLRSATAPATTLRSFLATQNSSYVTVSPNLLTAGASFTVSLMTINWLGVNHSMQSTVSKEASDVPSLLLRGASNLTIQSNQALHLFVESRPTFCSSLMQATVVYQWAQISGPSLDLSSVSLTQTTFYLPPGMLSANAIYGFQASVALSTAPQVKNTISITATVVHQDLVSVISGGSRLISLFGGSNLTLNGSQSYDPDFLLTPSRGRANLTYLWSCELESSTPCFAFGGWTTAVLRLPSSLFASYQETSRFYFSLRVSKGSRQASSTAVIQVTLLNAPTPSIDPIPALPPVNPGQKLTLFGRAPQDSPSARYARWWVCEAGGLQLQSANSSVLATSVNNTQLVLQPNVLTPGASYTFALYVQQLNVSAAFTLVGVARVSFTANAAPRSGSCFAEPASGTYTTDFTLRCDYWADEVDHQPLEYRFVLRNQLGSGNTNTTSSLELRSFQTLGSFVTRLPPGPAAASHVVSLRAFVRDRYGATVSYAFSVVVTPPPLTNQTAVTAVLNDLSSQINASMQSGDMESLTQNVAMIVSVMDAAKNVTNSTAGQAMRSRTRQLLLDSVRNVSSTSANRGSDEAIGLNLQVVNLILSDPADLTPELRRSAADVLEQQTQLGTVRGSSNNVNFTTPQFTNDMAETMLNAFDRLLTSSLLANQSHEDNELAQSFLRSSSAASKALVAGYVDGEEPLHITSGRVSLTASRVSQQNMGGSTISAGSASVGLPSSLSNSSSSNQASRQVSRSHMRMLDDEADTLSPDDEDQLFSLSLLQYDDDIYQTSNTIGSSDAPFEPGTALSPTVSFTVFTDPARNGAELIVKDTVSLEDYGCFCSDHEICDRCPRAVSNCRRHIWQTSCEDEGVECVWRAPQASEFVVLALPHVREVNTSEVAPVCRFWNEELSQWSTEGCLVLDYQTNVTTCACNHLTTFSLEARDFLPNINPLTLSDFSAVTWANISHYPVPFIALMIVYGMFFIGFYFAHRRDQKLDLASIDLIVDLNFKGHRQTTLHAKVQGLTLRTISKRMLSHHLWVSVYFREAGSSFTSVDRLMVLCCYLACVFTINAAFFGQEKWTFGVSFFTVALIGMLGSLIPVYPAYYMLHRSRYDRIKQFMVSWYEAQVAAKSLTDDQIEEWQTAAEAKRVEFKVQQQREYQEAMRSFPFYLRPLFYLKHKYLKHQPAFIKEPDLDLHLERSHVGPLIHIKDEDKEPLKQAFQKQPWLKRLRWHKFLGTCWVIVVVAICSFLILTYGMKFDLKNCDNDRSRSHEWLQACAVSNVIKAFVQEPLSVAIQVFFAYWLTRTLTPRLHSSSDQPEVVIDVGVDDVDGDGDEEGQPRKAVEVVEIEMFEKKDAEPEEVKEEKRQEQ